MLWNVYFNAFFVQYNTDKSQYYYSERNEKCIDLNIARVVFFFQNYLRFYLPLILEIESSWYFAEPNRLIFTVLSPSTRKITPWNVLKEIPSSAAILNARNRILYSTIYYLCCWIYNNNYYNSPPSPTSANGSQCERTVSWRVPKPTTVAIFPGFLFYFFRF